MSKRKKASKKQTNGKVIKGKFPQVLESGRIQDIPRNREIAERHIQYHWRYYSELAQQREQVLDELLLSFNEMACGPFEIENWHRIVRYKYGLTPFSAIGSVRNCGGRFNLGSINSQLSTFPALYLAEDMDTARFEAFGQGEGRLDPESLALTNPESLVQFAFNGLVCRFIDLRDHKKLQPMVDIIKQFGLSASLRKQSKVVEGVEPAIVSTSKALADTLLDSNWRERPMIYDIPANSQIFGHLAYQAGIEGILYPSKFNGKLCLALFPENFNNTDSFLTLVGEPPDSDIPIKLDSDNFNIAMDG